MGEQIKTRLIRQAAKQGGFNQLQSQEQLLYQWAVHILELDILNTKLAKAGGKMDALSPAEQEKYRQLTGQST